MVSRATAGPETSTASSGVCAGGFRVEVLADRCLRNPAPRLWAWFLDSEGGETSVRGTCVSCGMTDVELNEQGECEDCASGGAEDDAEEE